MIKSKLLVCAGICLFANATHLCAQEKPLISNVAHDESGLTITWNVKTNAFIVVRYDSIPGEGLTVVSSRGLTEQAAMVSTENPMAFFTVMLGLRAVDFNDPLFEGVVRSALENKMTPTNRVYDCEAAGIRFLNLSGMAVGDLTGLEYLSGLTNLVLRSSGLAVIAPLGALRDLSSLELGGNRLGALTDLTAPTNLVVLGAANNEIADLAGLQALPGLRVLDVGNNHVEEIGVLAGMHDLEELYLDHNRIQNIDALAGLLNLNTLDLSGNRIRDIQSLIENARNGGLGHGDTVHLSGNKDLDLNQIVELRAYGVNVIFP
jgi:hypothetical protein